jgi:DNA-binding protein HU-beta
MNKGQLIDAVASHAGLTKVQAEKALNAVIDTVSETLSKGDTVALIGFGTFGVAKRAARNGKNPRTGATIKIPARKVPKFTPGKGLKDVVNGLKKPAAKKAAPAKAPAKKAPAKKK